MPTQRPTIYLNGLTVTMQLTLNGPAHTPAFLQADNIPLAEVPAARPLAEVASDGAGMAQLWRGHLRRRLHQERVLRLDDRMFNMESKAVRQRNEVALRY